MTPEDVEQAPESADAGSSAAKAPEKKPGRITRTYRSAWTKGETTAQKAKDWTERQEETSRSGVVIHAYNRYRDAEGPLYGLVLTAYALIAILPTALVVTTFVKSDPTALADRLTSRLNLSGATAAQLHDILTGASGHKVIALLIAIGSVVFSALGFGRAMQRVTAGAWRMPEPENDWHNQVRCQVWFLTLLFGIILIVVVNVLAASSSSGVTWGLVPVWCAATVAFFAWTPSYLLHRNVPWRDSIYAGLVTGVGILVLQVLSATILTNWLNWYSKYYGTLGIVLAFVFWLMLIMGAIVIGTAFAGAYAERRRALKGAPADAPADASPAAGS